MQYNPRKIETKWRKIWKQKGVYEPDLKRAKKPFYNLMMFPYPSAEGLHVGNMYAFTGSDIYGRFKRMRGYDVFEPIGLDGFGIHSENYAIRAGVHPTKQAKISEKRFYKQLEMIGNGFAWKEKLETYDPNYYKWTQWIFVKMFKNGLAYRKKAEVNWCPSCKTVLADEQVINGKCERCSTEVVKRELEQWFFRITKYAERLLRNLEKIDWSERVKIAQREWIGKSEGATIKFEVKSPKSKVKSQKSKVKSFLEVFTTRPDTLFGATYMVLAPEHSIIKNLKLKIKNYDKIKKYVERAKKKTGLERLTEDKQKTGVELKEIKAVNPATKKEIPIFVADYVLMAYGAGAIMAVPSHDSRDWDFAEKYGLAKRQVIVPPSRSKLKTQSSKLKEAYEGEGILINSGKFNGMDSEKAKWAITKFVGGKKTVQYHLRDWLISRQRYWGPPIPMIYCEECGWQSAPENQLPVKLPFVKDFRPKGTAESPLATVKSFYETKCPACDKKARRETDVSDTFLDSAWYYLGYLMKSGNWKLGFGNSAFAKLTRRWLPVNLYTGGAEHSVLHLLYVRFLAMALYDMGLLHFEEPFPKFRAHGLLIKEGAKMSKSKGNVVTPDEYIKRFGADILRMYLMFLAPFEQGGDFRDAGIIGIKRFLERIWRFYADAKQRISANPQIKEKKFVDSDKFVDLNRLIHKTIKKVTEDIEDLRFNTAISALMILFNELEKQTQLSIVNGQLFLKLLAPFAPHLSEELWHQHQSASTHSASIHLEKWPKYDPKVIAERTFELIIQVNGKVRGRLIAPVGITKKEAAALASEIEVVKKYLATEPKNIIFVPNKLINFVV
jgi:leucyl-tRNA synthetase